VCTTEIEHYLKQKHDGRLVAVNISAADFDPKSYKISLEAFMYELHVIDQGGEIYCGVDAFRAIWQAFPASMLYRTMNIIIGMPIVNQISRVLYKGFASIRPYLPKRHECNSGTCYIDRKH
jgi:predicted DCC family thiol-disulfide oxidoreductase YuxK